MFVGLIPAYGKDEPVTEGNAETRGAVAQNSTKGGGMKLDATGHGEYHYKF